ncbi:MAG: histidine--tRNA ligase [Bacteroidota bacterium]|nr:histidine--tRNA ligase [Candidatus Kapabacteria bacterium]MCS7303125.1 histidine--tRNA ligase [Candidatus Kapabacteria bacterium]MCX7936263.1 histidine--tRNA ligase [Chlorobiota bacterium]MDW8271068.1 histidine--tRNA ligase [Bacteroidota bacterium]
MGRSNQYQTVRGTRDILPEEIHYWHRIETTVAEWMRRYQYQEIRTPIIEVADLFYHGVGQETDAIGKEMYVFPDRSGEMLALRPELTAPIARAVHQHSLAAHRSLLRLWYYGPCFRYERPQKGRQRQFHQVGAECIGSSSPDADVEVIALAWDILRELCDTTTLTVSVNSLGTREEQARYRSQLVEYFSQYRNDLSPISQQRLTTNPLRILDSKDPTDRAIICSAPHIIPLLSVQSRAHFDTVLTLLDSLGIPVTIDPHLVRGLDYYTHTVFEFRSNLLGAQDAVGGGGRYDNLVEALGGPPLPGVGFGIGVERLLLAMDIPPVTEQSWQPAVFIAAPENMRVFMHHISSVLRRAGIATAVDLEFRSLKAQLRLAHRMRYAVCLIVSPPPHGDNTAVIKDMRSGEQVALSLEDSDIVSHVQRLLKQQ